MFEYRTEPLASNRALFYSDMSVKNLQLFLVCVPAIKRVIFSIRSEQGNFLCSAIPFSLCMRSANPRRPEIPKSTRNKKYHHIICCCYLHCATLNSVQSSFYRTNASPLCPLCVRLSSRLRMIVS